MIEVYASNKNVSEHQLTSYINSYIPKSLILTKDYVKSITFNQHQCFDKIRTLANTNLIKYIQPAMAKTTFPLHTPTCDIFLYLYAFNIHFKLETESLKDKIYFQLFSNLVTKRK